MVDTLIDNSKPKSMRQRIKGMKKRIQKFVWAIVFAIGYPFCSFCDLIRSLWRLMMDDFYNGFLPLLTMFVLVGGIMYAILSYNDLPEEEKERTRHRETYEIYNAVNSNAVDILSVLQDVTNRLDKIERKLNEGSAR